MQPRNRSFSGTLLRSFTTFVVAVVAGGIAVGACLAALIPGTVEIATAHHYTAGTVKNLRALSQQSTVYWSDGVTPMPCGQLGIEIHDPVATAAEVPARLVNAVIATEDRSFWTNDGIDLGGVFRAFVTNLVSGRIEQGGSTITQQLVKKRILSDKRDVHRKLKEIIYALRINKKFSKEKILTEYLNTVYFGENSYGIKSAAERFFNVADPASPFGLRAKTMQELTIGEAALLAGSISSPVGNDPFIHPEQAKVRRAQVLRGEVEEGYITQAEADAANNEPLPTIRPPAELRPCNYLVAEVRDRLLADPRMGATPDERRETLLRGGLKIVSTFDPRLQAEAQDATDNAKPQKGPDWISSLVAIEPSSGAVRAMVGGPDFADSEFNIATHPVGRQPGSTWKVITLAAALQLGYSPNDIVNGTSPCSVPKVFPDPKAVTQNAEPHEGGNMDIWEATAGSVNCAFVRISTSVGQSRIIKFAHDLGITQARPLPNDQFLTLSIGTVEATPLEMATIMATVANGGVKHTPFVVQKVTRPDGRVVFDESNNPAQRVIDQDVANCEINVLRGVVTHGTGTAANSRTHTIFGKTGTTDNLADAWFIGATPQLATAVWFGNRTGNISGAGFGGSSSAPIFRAFMDPALDGLPDLGIPPAGPVCSRPSAFVNENGGRSSAPVTPPAPPPPSTLAPPPTPTAPAATSPPDVPKPPDAPKPPDPPKPPDAPKPPGGNNP
jgi:penicillin-binding protein 1A